MPLLMRLPVYRDTTGCTSARCSCPPLPDLALLLSSTAVEEQPSACVQVSQAHSTTMFSTAGWQVAESEETLVQRLVERKSEALVGICPPGPWV